MSLAAEIVKAIVPDLRVWDRFYAIWKPVSMVTKAQVSHHADFQIDVMTLELPAPHPLDDMWMSTHITGTPVTLRINGVWWTGRVQTAMKRLVNGVESWQITIHSDDKHLHRLVSLTPSTGAAAASKNIKGSFRVALRTLMKNAAARTGIPLYLRAATNGPDVDIIARVEDTVAGVLSPTVERSPIYVNVTALTPDMVRLDKFDGSISQYMGDAERQWYEKAVQQGVYPPLEPHNLITASPLETEYEQPPSWFYGKTTLDERAQQQAEKEGMCWTPFELDSENKPKAGFYDDGRTRVIPNATRVATANDLKIQQRHWPWFGQFVSMWSQGRWQAGNGLAALPAALQAGKVIRYDTGKVVPFDELDSLNRYIGFSEAYVWQKPDKTWVVANKSDFDTEYASRVISGPQPPYPGVLVHLHGGRDRRNLITFGTGPGGGLESWEATISAPEAAALIAGAQWGKWSSAIMRENSGKQVTVSADRVAGELPGAANAVASSGGSVTSMTADIRPGVTVDGTEVSFSTLTAGMDMGIVGPLFYREKFHSVGSDEWNADVAANFEAEWANMQGNTAMSLSIGSNICVFGDDVTTAKGTVVPGWREGDRVSFHDRDTTVTEVITGWEASWGADQPTPRITPLLGKKEDRYTPVDQLVDLVRKIQKAGERSQLEPPRLPERHDIVEVAKEAFTDEAVDWNQQVRDSLDEARKAAAQAQEARAGSTNILRESRRLLSGPANGDFKSIIMLHNEILEKHDETLAAQAVVDAAQNNAIAAVQNANAARDSALVAAAQAREQLTRQIKLIDDEQKRAQVRDDVFEKLSQLNRTEFEEIAFNQNSHASQLFVKWVWRNGDMYVQKLDWNSLYDGCLRHVSLGFVRRIGGAVTDQTNIKTHTFVRDEPAGSEVKVGSPFGTTIRDMMIMISPSWDYKKLLSVEMKKRGLV